MVRTTIIAVALACIAAPAGARCWQVDTLPSGDFVTTDLAANTYIEYRTVGPVTPPAASNPAHYRVIFTLMLMHALESDEIVASTIVAEARYPDREAMVMLDEAHSSIDLWIDGGKHLADQGDAIGLIKTRTDIVATDPIDPVGGRAVYGRAIGGGTVHMRFTYQAAGKPSLDASMDGGFRPDTPYQKAARARALGYAAEKKRTGKCPLANHD